MEFTDGCEFCGEPMIGWDRSGGFDTFQFKHGPHRFKVVAEATITEWASLGKSLAHEVSKLFHPDMDKEPMITVTMTRYQAVALRNILSAGITKAKKRR